MGLIEKSDDMRVGFFSLRGAPVRQRRAGSAANLFQKSACTFLRRQPKSAIRVPAAIAEPITPVAPPQPAAQTPAAQTPAANTDPNTDANVDVSGAQLNRKDFTLSRGEKFTMKVSGTTATPRWDVDDPNVAVVNENGVVTGVGGGTTTLHCKVGDRDLTCIVRVK